MKCTLCEKEIGDIESAIEEGWMPQFYVGEQEYDVACPTCSEKYLQMGADGEMELRPEYTKTFMDSSSYSPPPKSESYKLPAHLL
jgi:DNA-directed RNA polymerase subunit RPC12/RpoP